MILGIDAGNIRGGGGCTHLREFIRSLDQILPAECNIVVWGGKDTLSILPSAPWLKLVEVDAYNHGILKRSIWQVLGLNTQLRSAGCDVLFVPGGNYFGNFHPVITMSQNLLPFQFSELRRYGYSLMTLKMLLLRFTQSSSFRRSDGVLFLSKFAYRKVTDVTGKLRGLKEIIPHGIDPRFFSKPQTGDTWRDRKEINLIYVSVVDHYKHQWKVVEGIAIARANTGVNLKLTLVGPYRKSALPQLEYALKVFDPDKEWAAYIGPVSYDDIHTRYQEADAAIFASTCENLPNIVVEKMASGLPIVSSMQGPMPEVLEDSALYFDPEDPKSLADALQGLIDDDQRRDEMVGKSYSLSLSYSWEQSAYSTFRFIEKVTQSQSSDIRG